MGLGFANIFVLFIFCILLSKTFHLNFREGGKDGDSLRRQYWELLNVEIKDDEQVEVGDKKENYIVAADSNVTRVNLLAEQYLLNILCFIGFLMPLYLVFIIDTRFVLNENFEASHLYFKWAEDLLNFTNSVFIALGFMVLYNKTIDKKDKKFYYQIPILFLSLIFVAFYAGSILYLTNKANKTSVQAYCEIRENLRSSLTFNDKHSFLLSRVKLISSDSLSCEALQGNLSQDLSRANEKNAANSINGIDAIIGPLTSNSNEEETKSLGKIREVKQIIDSNKMPLKTIWENVLQLIIGSLNGLTMALLFGRYISMEQALRGINRGGFYELIRWGTIIILPAYALAQPLFGNFEIDAFGSPQFFANCVIFACLVGKIFFLGITFWFMKKRFIHEYLHSILVNYGIPKNFQDLFDAGHQEVDKMAKQVKRKSE
jgi:hypothetical protein